MNAIHDDDTAQLALTTPQMEYEFEVATYHAVVNMQIDFEFHGFTIDTAVAVDVVHDIKAKRTYH